MPHRNHLSVGLPSYQHTQDCGAWAPVLPQGPAAAAALAGACIRQIAIPDISQKTHSLQRRPKAAPKQRSDYAHSPMRRLWLAGLLGALLTLVAQGRSQPGAPPALSAWLQWPWQPEQGPRRTLLASDSLDAFKVGFRAPTACGIRCQGASSGGRWRRHTSSSALRGRCGSLRCPPASITAALVACPAGFHHM